MPEVRIVQNLNENISDFITRIIEERNLSGSEVVGVTTNGIEIRTSDYSNTDNLYSAMMEGYGNIWNSELSENILNEDLEENTLSIGSPLDLLTEAAIENSKYKYITSPETEISDLKMNIELEKAEAERIIESIKDDYKQKIGNFNKQKKSLNNEKTDIELNYEALLNERKAKIDEYIQDRSEQEVKYREAIRNYRGAISNIKNMITTPEIEKYINNLDREANIDTLHEIARKIGPDALEGISRLRKAKWDMEAYEEYISFINSEIQNNNVELEVIESEKNIALARVDNTIATLNKKLLESMPLYKEVDGKKIVEIEDDERIQAIKQNVANLEDRIEHVKSHPIMIRANIEKLMAEKANPDLIAKEVDKLSSYIESSEIFGIYEGDEDKLIDINVKISDLQAKKLKLEDKLNSEQYLDKNKVEIDIIRKKAAERAIDKNDMEIDLLEVQLEESKDNTAYKALQDKKKKYEKLMLETKKNLSKYQRVNGVNPDDIQEIRYHDSLCYYQEAIKDIEEQEKEYDDMTKIRKSTKTLEKELEKAQSKQKVLESKLESIKEEIEKSDYIDEAAINSDENELEQINQELEILNGKKDFVESHSISDIKNQIIMDYKKETKTEFEVEDEELVENLHPIKDKIKEKIKTNAFKETVVKGIAGIVTAASIITSGFGKTKSVSEDNTYKNPYDTATYSEDSIFVDENRFAKGREWMSTQNAANTNNLAHVSAKNVNFSKFYSKDNKGNYYEDPNGTMIKLAGDNKETYVSIVDENLEATTSNTHHM